MFVIFVEATRQYERKVGAEGTDKSNKTSIMAQIDGLREKLEEHYAVVMVHKAKAHPKKGSHRYVHLLCNDSVSGSQTVISVVQWFSGSVVRNIKTLSCLRNVFLPQCV